MNGAVICSNPMGLSSCFAKPDAIFIFVFCMRINKVIFAEQTAVMYLLDETVLLMFGGCLIKLSVYGWGYNKPLARRQ